MKATIKVKIGQNVLELSSDSFASKDFQGFAFWTSLPSTCGACKSDKITLNHRATDKGAYFGLRCLSCTADLTFHQKKAENGGGFYMTPEDKWSVWKPKAGSQNEKKEKDPDTIRDEGDDIPF